MRDIPASLLEVLCLPHIRLSAIRFQNQIPLFAAALSCHPLSEPS